MLKIEQKMFIFFISINLEVHKIYKKHKCKYLENNFVFFFNFLEIYKNNFNEPNFQAI